MDAAADEQEGGNVCYKQLGSGQGQHERENNVQDVQRSDVQRTPQLSRARDAPFFDRLPLMLVDRHTLQSDRRILCEVNFPKWPLQLRLSQLQAVVAVKR